jgi:hypothetical protein
MTLHVGLGGEFKSSMTRREEIVSLIYCCRRERPDLSSIFHPRLARLLCIASIAVGAWLSLASAARAEPPPGISFDIPSQPLEAALDVYGAVTRTQVFYETALAAGRQSNQVKGVYTPYAALRLLLGGTGLDFDYTTERTVALTPARRPASNARSQVEGHPDIGKFDHFLGGVQAGVMAALCGHPEARPGDFKVAVRFWITGSGAIANPALLASTGKPSRDLAITNILARLAFSEPPPAQMPQPITMVLTTAASPRDRDSCADAERG